jgi:predicted transcriptional regulator
MTNYSFIKTVVSTLNLTKTDSEILKILKSVKGGLLISEIIEKIKRSERNIRKRLNLLNKKGLLIKKVEVLKNNRLAYRYFLESENIIVEKAKIHLSKKIEELNSILLKNNNTIKHRNFVLYE